ncbi:sensor histidine kinase [Agromyces atrinae]|uniref:Signal transduction histidine kinase n=1 Tax=Agromyces atrinae TaxID=592376 RepID=A0A4Q2M7R0_9MICO|nr:ATP-binding protein [Agromyces atrinae]NYD68495.1 signal transduction histidine kinase [Agromyces atrinae]RXZ85882.1 hypothetical protein ESP50_11730 [Agromyces atrinae]
MLLALGAIRASIVFVRVLAGVTAVGYIGLLVLWAFDGPIGVAPHGDVWPLSLTAIPAVTAVVAYPRPPVWGYLAITTAFTFVIAERSSSSPDATVEALEIALYSAVFCSIFVGCSVAAIANARRLDASIVASAAKAREHAAAAARERERARFEALIHDGVISTLLMAGRGTLDSVAGAAQAQRTLAELADVREPGGAAISTDELDERLRSLLATYTVWVDFLRGPLSELALPADVAEALESATAEAVRNSVVHAGPRVRRAVLFSVTDDAVEIVVRDDGRGFDRLSLPPGRLGLTRSIEARMRAIPGGSASVVSAPGEGTRVSLVWEAR